MFLRTDITNKLREKIFYLDCGMGTSLQNAGLGPGECSETFGADHPELITAHHVACYNAGADAVYANTFGINGIRYSDSDCARLAASALLCANKAREAAEREGRELYVGLDIGPTGKMLEPFGNLPFEDAVDAFAALVRSADRDLYDFIVIETMTDMYETKAAVIAAKENSDRPIFVTNVYGSDCRMLTGGTPEAMVTMLEGLGVGAIGLNCSLGPKDMVETVRRLSALCSLPIIAKPNAGLPDKVGDNFVYSATPESFSEEMSDLVSAGATVIGGCCGTTPEFISALVKTTSGMPPVLPFAKSHCAVCSFSKTVFFDGATVPIGERINPTGKKKLKEALKDRDMAYITEQAVGQAEAGALVLDINVGMPGIDEADLMRKAIRSVQSVSDLPLQIDSSDPAVLEVGMRTYIGKPLVNSVNGKEEIMHAVFPLVKKYGGTLIALTIDENGIPSDADGRIAIAEKIIKTAAEYGISERDIIVDPLAMAVSAEPNAALVSLECVKRLHECGIRTSLGVSNVSFGLPDREAVNSTFLAMAMQNGLSAAIINPYSIDTMKVMRAAEVILARDENCANYIGALSLDTNVGTPSQRASDDITLYRAIVGGMVDKAGELALEELKTRDPLDIVNKDIIPALDRVGTDFENKKVFLPSLLTAAHAVSAAFEKIKAVLPKTGGKYTVVIATVKGDIHDIGKNIVATLLENYGYNVVDLGKDVPPEAVADAAIESGARLVGLSALMTTTLPAMQETLDLLHKRCPDVKTVVGGAVVTDEWARFAGADKYAADAMETVRYAEELLL